MRARPPARARARLPIRSSAINLTSAQGLFQVGGLGSFLLIGGSGACCLAACIPLLYHILSFRGAWPGHDVTLCDECGLNRVVVQVGEGRGGPCPHSPFDDSLSCRLCKCMAPWRSRSTVTGAYVLCFSGILAVATRCHLPHQLTPPPPLCHAYQFLLRAATTISTRIPLVSGPPRRRLQLLHVPRSRDDGRGVGGGGGGGGMAIPS